MALRMKKTACAVSRAKDTLGDVNTIASTIRIGTRRHTSNAEIMKIITSFFALVLPTDAEATLTIDWPTITADTMDHSGRDRKVRNSPRWVRVMPITMNGSRTKSISDDALTNMRASPYVFSELVFSSASGDMVGIAWIIPRIASRIAPNQTADPASLLQVPSIPFPLLPLPGKALPRSRAVVAIRPSRMW